MNNTANDGTNINVDLRIIATQDFGGNTDYRFTIYKSDGSSATLTPSSFNATTTQGAAGANVETVVSSWVTYNTLSIESTNFQIDAKRNSGGTTRIKKLYMQVKRN